MSYGIRSPRGVRRGGRQRNRRGATLVLFALLIVPLLTLAALAIDASQWQAGANQLQTVADAAALAAARGAQMYTDGGATATAYANSVAAANSVLGSAGTVALVEPGVFAKATGAFTANGNWTTRYNAVRVTSQASGRSIFSRVVRPSDPVLERSAIAWIANVNSGSCVKPMGLPYSLLYHALNSASTMAPAESLLTLGQAARIRDSSLESRTLVIYSPAQTAPAVRSVGNWDEINFSSTSGRPVYDRQWSTDNCSGATSVVGVPPINTLTNGQWSIDDGADSLLANTCKQRSGYGDLCFVSTTATVPGVSIRVTWVSTCASMGVSCSASASKVARVVGTFTLMCVFTGTAGEKCPDWTGGGIAVAPSGSAGNWAPRFGPSNLRITPLAGQPASTALSPVPPRGSVVGIINGISSAALGPGVTLGDSVGDVQRLILAR